MDITSKKVTLAVTVLPLAALGIFFLGAKPLQANEDLCVYAGKNYSVGAQISNSCSGNKTQSCLEGGSWSTCQ